LVFGGAENEAGLALRVGGHGGAVVDGGRVVRVEGAED
jgi:hypothetical protein